MLGVTVVISLILPQDSINLHLKSVSRCIDFIVEFTAYIVKERGPVQIGFLGFRGGGGSETAGFPTIEPTFGNMGLYTH